MQRILFFVIFIAVALGIAQYIFRLLPPKNVTPAVETITVSGQLDEAKSKTNVEWKQILTPQQYYILREAGTELPFTGNLEYEHRKGTYYSVGCETPIFRSEQKYESGTGWPSFWNPISPDALVLKTDDSLAGEARVEVLDVCGGHLGHVFDDGPQPTGKRYCMNSAAMYFVPDENQ